MSQTLSFFRETRDITEIGDRAASTDRIAFGLGVAETFRSTRTPFHDAVAALHPEEIDLAWSHAESLRTFIAAEMKGLQTIFGNLGIGEVLRNEIEYFSREAAISSVAVRRIIKNFPARTVLMARRPRSTLAWHGIPLIFEAVAQHVLQIHGRTLRMSRSSFLDQIESLSNSTVFRMLPQLTTGLGMVSRLQERLRRQNKYRSVVLFAGHQQDLHSSVPIIKELRRRDVPCRSLVFSPDRQIRIAMLELGAEPTLLWNFQSFRDLRVRSRLQAAFENLVHLGQSSKEWFSTDVFGNPLLHRHHLRALLVERAARLAIGLTAIDRLLEQLDPAVVVTSLDSSGLPLILVQQARLRNIPSISFAHGGMMDWSYISFTADTLLAWGPAQKRRLDRYGSVTIAGSPRYDHLTTVPNLTRPDSSGLLDASKRLILVTPAASSTGGALLSPLDPTSHVRTFEALASIPRRIPRTQVVVKPHPRYDELDFYEALSHRFHGDLVVLDRKTPLLSLLDAASLVILPNVPTDAAIEAILLGVPVIFVTAAWRPQIDNGVNQPHDPRMDTMLVGDVTALVSAVESVFSDTEARANLLAANEQFLHQWVSEVDGLSASRCAATISETAANSMSRFREQR